jgi:hypothetical protein
MSKEPTTTPEAFVAYWSEAGASERANAQPFLISLARLLGVPEPEHTHTLRRWTQL